MEYLKLEGTHKVHQVQLGTLTFVYIRLGETLEGSFGRDLDWTITCGQLQLAPAGVPPQDKPDGCVP